MPTRRYDDEYDDQMPRRRPRWRCPFCGSGEPPDTQSKVSTAGWIIFVILLLVCFPMCFIGLLVRDEYRVCADCGTKFG